MSIGRLGTLFFPHRGYETPEPRGDASTQHPDGGQRIVVGAGDPRGWARPAPSRNLGGVAKAVAAESGERDHHERDKRPAPGGFSVVLKGRFALGRHSGLRSRLCVDTIIITNI